MADETISVRSLKLGELLGSTLVAVIEADALAAKATLEYIETVGFSSPPEGDEETTGATTAAGRLRMAQFQYSKRDETNQVADFVAEVPILSLVPIPALQVQNATFSFALKIDDITKTSDDVAPGGTDPQLRPTPKLLPFIRPAETQIVARPAAASGQKTQEVKSTHHIEVQVTMAQADVTVGMERIFNLLDQAIQDRKAPSE
jgi:Protein of unknown function (DUF2589)